MGNGVEREGGEKELVIGKGVAWDGRIRYIGGGSLCWTSNCLYSNQ